MVSSDLGACEWFVWDLRRSGLIDRGQLDQVIGEFLRRNPRAEPPALAEYLVTQGVLSTYQAERILGGKSQGLVLGPYVLTDVLGSGSMGQVFRALSKTDGQEYAIKVLPRRSMWNVRLARRQVRAFTQFSHPAVVPFVDVGTSGGQHYLAWPLVSGESLEGRVQRQGKLSLDEVAQIGIQIAHGLTISHQNGLFHGLIKPSNILITEDGQARILDFGIGSLLVENDSQESLVDTMSTSNTLMSGLDCASPESIMEPTNRTPAGDQYSLGCVLYFCLSGQVPFPEGTAVEKMTAHQLKQPKSLGDLVPGLPDGVIEIVERLMQKKPENRFRGMDEVVDALQSYTPQTASHRGSSSAQHPSLSHGPTPAPVRSSMTGTPTPGLPRPRIAPAMSQSATSSTGVVASSGTTRGLPRPQVAVPTRGMLRSSSGSSRPLSSSAIPGISQAESTPLPVSAPEPAPAATATPAFQPAWEAEQPARSGFGPLVVLVVAGLLIALTYFLGKNYIFPG